MKASTRKGGGLPIHWFYGLRGTGSGGKSVRPRSVDPVPLGWKVRGGGFRIGGYRMWAGLG